MTPVYFHCISKYRSWLALFIISPLCGFNYHQFAPPKASWVGIQHHSTPGFFLVWYRHLLLSAHKSTTKLRTFSIRKIFKIRCPKIACKAIFRPTRISTVEPLLTDTPKSGHPWYNGQFWKSQLSFPTFHSLQYLSNPWRADSVYIQHNWSASRDITVLNVCILPHIPYLDNQANVCSQHIVLVFRFSSFTDSWLYISLHRLSLWSWMWSNDFLHIQLHMAEVPRKWKWALGHL